MTKCSFADKSGNEGQMESLLVSFQREGASFQANIDGVGYNQNEETKQTKNPNIRKKEALSLEN